MQRANADTIDEFFANADTIDEFFELYGRRLARATMRDELFIYATRFPGTPMGVRAQLLLDVPHVSEVVITSTTPGCADVLLELPVWSLLTLGILQLLTARRARRVLQRCAPAKCTLRIRTTLRPIARPAQLAGALARSSTRIA
jgi:hypothetical protein